MIKERDGEVFAQMMLAAAEAYGKKMSRALLEMLFNDLSQYTVEQVQQAFTAHRRDPINGRFFPITADFVKHIEGMPVDVANQAWMTVYRAIKQHGRWQTVCFDDPAIHAAIASMGGWIKLCGNNDDEMVFAQKDFLRLYGAASKDKMLLQSSPRYLIGEETLHNNKLGEPVKAKDIALIGDRQKCMLIAARKSDATPHVLAGVKLKQIPQ